MAIRWDQLDNILGDFGKSLAPGPHDAPGAAHSVSNGAKREASAGASRPDARGSPTPSGHGPGTAPRAAKRARTASCADDAPALLDDEPFGFEFDPLLLAAGRLHRLRSCVFWPFS